MDKITDQIKLTAAILQTDPGATYGKSYVQASNGMRIKFTRAGVVESITGGTNGTGLSSGAVGQHAGDGDVTGRD
jgi:hypothetical protein